MHKYWKHGLFLSNALTKCFIIPTLMCKGGSRIFSRSTKLTFETFLDPGCSRSLSGQCTVSKCLSLALLCHSHRKQGHFVYPLCSPSSNPMTFKSPHICHSCSWYLTFQALTLMSHMIRAVLWSVQVVWKLARCCYEAKRP